MASASTDRRRRSSAASTHTSSSSGAAVAASAAAAANHKSNHKQNKSALSDDVSKRKDEGDIRARVYMISASSDEGKSNGNVKGGLCTTAFLEAMKSRSDKQKKKSKLWLSTDDGDSSIASIDIDPDAPPPPVFAWIDLLHQMRRIMDASLMDTFGPDAVLQMPELTSSRPLSVTDECAIVPPLQSLGNRRALLIGVRYKDRHRGGGGGGEHLDELVSSHPDVHNMAQYLETEHDFRPEHTIVLMDDGEHVSPTKKNIMNAIKLLVKLTKSGDIVFVHYSGTVPSHPIA
jgi:Caspase domain